MTYFDAACLAFGNEEFTVADFRNRLASARAAKILSELKTRGMVERVGSGRYRLLTPAERPDLRATEWDRTRNAILKAPLEKAWSGPTAVEKWTRGRYKVASSAFAREFHLAVPVDAVRKWRLFLAHANLPTDPRRSIGARVVLEPRKEFRMETLDDEPVVPRKDVVELIRSNPALFAGAEALLVG